MSAAMVAASIAGAPVIVDTSVWIDHLHAAEPRLRFLLQRNAVRVHPMIIAELALGSLSDRDSTLSLLASLPWAARADDRELLAFIERRQLFSRGLSLVDAHLLASALLDGSALWTHDRRLAEAAARLGVAAG